MDSSSTRARNLDVPSFPNPCQVPRALRIGAICLFLNLLASTVEASFQYELGLRSRHAWRGITLRSFPVLSASATYEHRGIAGQLWVGMDLADDQGRGGEIQEVDLDVSYTHTLSRGSFSLGYVALIFPDGLETTGEFYVKLSTDLPLQPGVEIYYNPDLLKDFFAILSVRQGRPIGESFRISAFANVAYAGTDYARFFGGSEEGFHHWGVGLDFDFLSRPGPNGQIRMRIGYSDSLNRLVLPEQPDRFWAGLYFTLSHP